MSNPDHEIERGVYQTPSNDDDLYGGYDEEEGFGRGPVFAIFAVIALAAFAGVVWLAYQQGVRQGQTTSPPIISASSEPFKVEPSDPEGMAEPEETLTDEVLAGQPLDQVADVTPSAEMPIETPPARTEAASSDTPSLRTSDAAAQPTIDASGGLVVPSPSERVQTADAGADLRGSTTEPRSSTSQPVVSQPATQPRSQPTEQPRAQPQPTVSETEGPPAPGASSTASTGNYVVQVASFPERADADAAWARLQSRYAAIVGSASQDVQSVDLGDRGTWYRLRIGYFGTSGDASTFCDQLKAAGQDCLVTSR